jgi:phospholipase C
MQAMQKLTRRELLRLGAGVSAAELAGLALHGCGGGMASTPSTPSVPAACSKLTDIEHVVILIQENRSFDHYFGSYRGVRGFSDQSIAFQQPNPANTTSPPIGKLLPFHLDTTKTDAACTHDITHDWVSQHQSWDGGAMDGFVTSRMASNANDAVLTMGYYNRADLPYYYALADAFTICDNYFCSVIGPTDPNRLYTMAASIDPDGKNGGPVLETIVTNRSAFNGRLTYTTMPEQLQTRGISWKVYSSPDETILGGILSENVLSYFQNYQDPNSVLHKNAFGPQFPTDFLADIASGNLPQVSWLIGSVLTSDHPPAPSLFGENVLSLIVTALSATPALWAKTVLFLTFDENGGFFDHVPPMTAPAGTRFLETRFGAEVPNLSAWRRAAVGDMTSALNFKVPDTSIPSLPATIPAVSATIQECANNLAGFTPYTVPSTQTQPTQESGTAAKPSGTC